MKYLFLILLAGCTIDSGYKANPGQIVDCTDSRNGERFTWRSENVEQKAGIGGPCMSGTDDNGKYRMLCENEQKFYQCNRR